MNLRITRIWVASLAALTLASCAQGLDDSERFSGGVTNTTLQSPVLTDESFSAIMNPDGTESVNVKWPVVYGAGGYLCNVAIVDNPSDPVKVVNDSILDGCSLTFPRLEDTKYEVSIKTLGNPKYNNKDAESASVYAYETMLPATTVPAGTEISQFINNYLAENPGTDEIGFELEGGATYQLDGVLDFGLRKATFRGNKGSHPTVVVNNEAAITTQAGLKVKWINFDCTNATADALLLLSNTPSETISIEALGYKALGANQTGYIIEDPVSFEDVKVKNLPKSFIYGNKTPWSLRDFRIENCLIQLNNATSMTFLNLHEGKNGLFKNLSISNSTIYNIVDNDQAYFIRYANQSNARPEKIFGTGEVSEHKISNCTFSKTFSGKDFANQMPQTNAITVRIDHCIFYDVFRLYQYMHNNINRYTSFNTICGITNPVNSNDVGGRKDTNGNPYATEENPDFTGPVNIELDLTKENGGVNFKPKASYASQNMIGDPRWFE